MADPTWTTELAYACGLMATDGCLIDDGRHLNLTSNDLDQLETFKECLGLKAKISWKRSGFTGKLSPQIQFGDAVLHRWFVSIGLTPRKSKTISEVKIPDKYFFDYLRGEFDGDGSSHAYWDARWHSSVSLYINFACASKPHLEWLNHTITRLLGFSGRIAEPYSRAVYTLRFAKSAANRLYQAMYYDAAIPFLRRKKEKLERQWKANRMAQQRRQPKGLIRGGSILRIA